MSASNSSSTSCLSKAGKKIIEWTRYYVYFAKPAFFVKGLVVAHGLVENAAINQLILYLTQDWKKANLPRAAAIMNTLQGVTASFYLIEAHLADAYFGDFKLVLGTTTAYITALALLMISAKWYIASYEIPVFCVALGLIAIGKAGKCSLSKFLSDQLIETRDDTNEKINARTDFWWYVLKIVGSIISVFFVASNGWIEIFWVSAAVMGAALFLFLFGTCFGSYNYVKPEGSPLTLLYNVVKAALWKRHLDYPQIASGYFMNEKQELHFSPHHPILRWMDKAAIAESLSSAAQETVNTENTSSFGHKSEKNLCSVAEVKKLKHLFTIIPFWATFFVYSLVQATGNTFFVEQSVNMQSSVNNYTISINYFFILKSLVSSVTSFSFSFLIPDKWSVLWKQRATLARIGIGMALSIPCCLIAWRVEVRRLRLIKLEIIETDATLESDITIPMSIISLIPQFIMLGLMKGLVTSGLDDFYDNYVDESMKNFRRAFNEFVLGTQQFLGLLSVLVVFQSWFCDTMNNSRLDKYYLMLAILSSGNFCIHALVSFKYTSPEFLRREDLQEEHNNS